MSVSCSQGGDAQLVVVEGVLELVVVLLLRPLPPLPPMALAAVMPDILLLLMSGDFRPALALP